MKKKVLILLLAITVTCSGCNISDLATMDEEQMEQEFEAAEERMENLADKIVSSVQVKEDTSSSSVEIPDVEDISEYDEVTDIDEEFKVCKAFAEIGKGFHMEIELTDMAVPVSADVRGSDYAITFSSLFQIYGTDSWIYFKGLDGWMKCSTKNGKPNTIVEIPEVDKYTEDDVKILGKSDDSSYVVVTGDNDESPAYVYLNDNGSLNMIVMNQGDGTKVMLAPCKEGSLIPAEVSDAKEITKEDFENSLLSGVFGTLFNSVGNGEGFDISSFISK